MTTVKIDGVKQLVCVQFPGVVKNVDNALKMLDGVDSLNQAILDSTQRLQLKFRPDDPYCKPVYGDRTTTQKLLLRIRRKKNQTHTDTTVLHEDCQVDVVGIVQTAFLFKQLVDFQYLPVAKVQDGSNIDLSTNILPFAELSDPQWLKGDSPLFILPSYFSSMVSSGNFNYDPKLDLKEEGATPDEETEHVEGENKKKQFDSLLQKVRFRTTGFTQFCGWDTDTPTVATKEAMTRIQSNPNIGVFDTLKQLFEERPIWSRNAMMVKLGLSQVTLKYFLPSVAYHMVSGPWRTMWVKLGFDPRKESWSKVFQVLDYRIKTDFELDGVTFRQRKGTLKHPGKLAATQGKLSSQLLRTNDNEKVASNVDKQLDTTTDDMRYKFRVGRIPPYKVMYYQYCDIEVDEIQALVKANDGAEQSCTEKDGWCLAGTADKCRKVVSGCVEQAIRDLEDKGEGVQAELVVDDNREILDHMDIDEVDEANDDSYSIT